MGKSFCQSKSLLFPVNMNVHIHQVVVRFQDSPQYFTSGVLVPSHTEPRLKEHGTLIT